MENKKIREAARKKAGQQAKRYLEKMSIQEQALLLRYDSPEIKHLGIPEYNWWNEALHGVARAGTATVFPVPLALAATFDDDLIEKIGDIISTEGRAKYNSLRKEGDFDIYKGLTYWSPNINLFRDPRWGRGHETFGEDPYLTAKMGTAFIWGIQGKDENFLKAAACVKHLAVHSGPEALRHEFDAKVDEKELWESYLPAFEHCVVHGQAEGAMGGYSSLNGYPLCGNYRLIQEILRDQWGFEGYYVSDCWAIRDFHEHHKVTDTPEESAAMAIKAGCDLNCGSCYQQLMKAYLKGLVTEAEIRQSAKRVLTTRLLLGMGRETPWDQLNYLDVDTPKAQEMNYKAACQSVVLLKNKGVLPLDLNHISKLSVIGPNADSTTVLQGNYHGTASHFTTVMEGIKGVLSGFDKEIRILYSVGCELVGERTERLAREYDRISEARAIAKAGDVVLLVVGLDERYEGEAHHISTGECIGGDREDILLPLGQRLLTEEVLSCGKPVILCCMSGSCMDLSAYEGRAAAILQAWYPGAEGGKAVADILVGNVSPSGKLPVTFYGSDYQLPEFTDYSMKNRTYRYAEAGVLYPFGFGLTYGRTQMREVSFCEEGNFVEFSIENSSFCPVDEVVQVYKKNCNSQYEVKHVSLCGFQRISLDAKAVVKGKIFLSPQTFTVVNDAGERIRDGNHYTLWVGTHGPDQRSCELTGSQVVRLEIKLETIG